MNMKNFYLILVIVCVFFYLTACQSSDRDNRYDSSNAETDKPIPQDTTTEDNKLNENTVSDNEYVSSFSELQAENLETIYKSDNCEVVTFDYSGPIIPCYAEWAAPPSYENAFADDSVIMTGIAYNVRSAVVIRELMGAVVSTDITIFDFEVEEVLSNHSDSIKKGDVVSVGVAGNVHKYYLETPIVEEEKSFLIFCTLASEIHNSMELSSYVDYFIGSNLYLFLERIGNSYLSINYFSDLSGALRISESKKDNQDAAEAYKVLQKRSVNDESELKIYESL